MKAQELRAAKARMDEAIRLSIRRATDEFRDETGLAPSSIEVQIVSGRRIQADLADFICVGVSSTVEL